MLLSDSVSFRTLLLFVRDFVLSGHDLMLALGMELFPNCTSDFTLPNSPTNFKNIQCPDDAVPED